ncbi:MAG: 50S ribosomal protein L18 [Bacteroidetes bacterium]|jgi:large subunit ribosomal protein L18|nr:50S ribosomal protein L18 [Bacteroidota bacterium]
MDKNKRKAQRRKKIHWRVRSSIKGTAERPRLNVYRSNKAIYAQIIDDTKNHTIVSANSLTINEGNKSDQAQAVGKVLAEKAKENNIEKVVFDRGGYLFHGRVKALAEGAREGGLKF